MHSVLAFCDEKYQRMTASICAGMAKSALVILGALLICLGCSTSEGQSTGHGAGLYVEIAIPGLEEDYGLLGGVLGENYYTIDTFYLDEDREGVITTDSLLAHGMYYAVFPRAQLSLQFLVSTTIASTGASARVFKENCWSSKGHWTTGCCMRISNTKSRTRNGTVP